MSASEWREFWASRGMRELRVLLPGAWPAVREARGEEGDRIAFRIASLLGSRAPERALADELGRIRNELGLAPAPDEDARAAATIADWFGTTTA